MADKNKIQIKSALSINNKFYKNYPKYFCTMP